MNYYNKFIFFILWCEINCISDKNWLFNTPEGTAMGLFLALALPIDILNRDIHMSYNFEVNYPLPGNNSIDVEYPPLVPQARKHLYHIIQTKFNNAGYDGHKCVLKMICAFSASSFTLDGILSDIFHIILKPSSSKEESINMDYIEAERNGHIHNCSMYNGCKLDILM